MIPYGKQSIDNDDIRAVLEVLHSDWLTQGPKVNEFEKALAQYCGARFAVAVSSGTAALHVACLAAGIGSNDEVITSPVTFAATANSVEFCGGTPVFADIDMNTRNISTTEIARHITKKTKTVIPVHFAGLPCDMQTIYKLAKENGLIVIEDACHALGAEYKVQSGKGKGESKKKNGWTKVGACRHSDMTVFSFHPVKHITTGEGGAILTNNKNLYERLLMFRNHGITRDASRFTFHVSQDYDPWYYEMQALGFNYRITDIQCALGLSQIRRLDRFIERRRAIAQLYNKGLQGIAGLETPVEPGSAKSSYHIYTLLIDFRQIRKTRGQVMEILKSKGIGTQVHYIPVHLHPYYRNKYGFNRGDYPAAESYYDMTLSIPMYPAMTDSDIKGVINILKEYICQTR